MATLLLPEDAGPADVNPYAPPESALAGAEPLDVGGDPAEAEATRRAYLGHEASVKSIGSLHYIATFFGLLVLFSLLSVLLTRTPANSGGIPTLVGTFVFYLALSGLHLALGMGLNRLQIWARWTDVVLLVISLVFLLLSAGTVVFVSVLIPAPPGALARLSLIYGFLGLITGYMLYLLLSKKGTMVFSPEYKQVIERTPHIRYKTSRLAWLSLIVLVALITFAVLGLLVARPG